MSSSSAIVCREIFDENSQPSAEEISEYAQQLGIDPESESHLLPLAKEGLMQALPAPWKAYFDEKLQIHYYYNEETKKTQWDHPLDNVYKEMVQKARDASMHEDTCASVQELLTSEEITKNLERVETKVESDEDLSTDNSENQSEQRERSAALVHGPKRLAPLGRPPIAPTFDKKLAELRMSPFRKSLDSPVVAKQIVRPEVGRLERPKFLKQNSEIIDLKMHVLTSPEEENFNLLSSSKSDKGLPFSGKGGLFLKSEKTDLPSPDTEKSLNLESFTKSDPPKGILRDKLIDSLHKKAEIAVHGKPKQTASFEEDRKSVRFKLEHTSVETTISPGSNSSSEPNDGQSSIISATPTNPVTNPSVNSPTLSLSGDSSPPVPLKSNFMIQSATSVNQNAASNIHNVHMMQRRPTVGLNLAPIGQMMMSNTPVLSSLSSRPPLPPRPQTSLDQILSPRDGSKSITDSFESDKGTSPKRRMIRPPPGDYIKPDLFQKNFQKISDLVRPGDIDSAPVNLDEPTSMEKEARPRSPMIPSMKNKISINLMESIESETSIDSPDREFANLDLNDMDDSKHDIEEQNSEKSDLKSEKSNNSDNKKHAAQNENLNNDDSEPFSPIVNLQKSDIPQIKIPKLDKLKSQSKIMHSDSEESKNTSPKDNYKLNTRSNSLDTSNNAEPRVLSPHYKPNIGSIPWSDFDARSGRSSPLTSSSPWSKPYVPTPTKSPETSLSKGLTSPRLDGVIISQGKSPNRSDVVVMYQFENPKEDTLMTKHIKSPLSADKTRDMIERNKADERRRLELSLQKELEEMRVEWTIRERSMRAEMQEDLKRNEERFKEEKRVRLAEQLERHQRIIKEELEKGKHDHQAALEATAMEQEERFRRETALVEMEYRENLIKLQSEHAKKLAEERKKLESESERTLAELSEQLQTNLHRERARLTEENRLTAETLRQEHANRITDLKHDYRAEVERLRTQHACHLEELRARLSGERAAAMRRPANDANLNEKYKCLKEKYARLKHDVKMSIERRNKRREMSMTTGSETEKSNSHKNNTQSLERCKEANESLIAATIEQEPPRIRLNNNPVIKYNDNETSLSESNAQKSDNNNEDWRGKRTDNNLASPETSQTSGAKSIPTRRKTAVAFKEPPRRRRERDRDANRDGAVTTDCQDSSDATTADEKPKEPMNGHGRRRCFTRLKSASTSRLNYSPKRGDGWSSPLESLRQQLRKLDDLEDQFPDLACQPNYSLRYPFNELVSSDRPELEFVRHRALVEREGMRRARQVLRTRRNALKETRDGVSPHRAPSEVTTSDGSSGSEAEVCESGSEVASGAVLRSLRALHADVRDIWRALDARRPHNVSASPETSSCNAATSQPRMSLSAQEPPRQDHSDGGVTERARGLRAWLQTAP